MAKKKNKSKAVQILHPHAAGIDVGADEHWVAVPEDRAERPVRSERSHRNFIVSPNG